MDYAQILSWVIVAVGLIGFYFAGKRKWWSWYINLGCQSLWWSYALATGQPAFLVSAAVYSAIFAWNAYKWTNDHLYVKKLIASDLPEDDPGFTTHGVEESNLVKHARHELCLIGEDVDVINWYTRVIKEYASFGHSGGSAWATIAVLEELLRFRPLTELTDDPEEWYHHGPDMWDSQSGIWQNKRDGRMFSGDGGQTYTCVDDPKDARITYQSIPKDMWKAAHAHVPQS